MERRTEQKPLEPIDEKDKEEKEIRTLSVFLTPPPTDTFHIFSQHIHTYIERERAMYLYIYIYRYIAPQLLRGDRDS